MKNRFANTLDLAHTRGVTDGFNASNVMFLIALHNTYEKYVDEDKIAPFARAIEREMLRIFQNEYNSDIAELALGHTDQIREKWRMDT